MAAGDALPFGLGCDMKLIVPILLTLLVVVQMQLWTGSGGIPEATRLHAALDAQLGENQRLRERNQGLAAQVEDLKSGSDAIEELARGELGMIRADETFHQIIDSQ
jgi:cell division protein FtsB